MIKVLHWILGIAAALSLVLGIIFKLADVVIFGAGPAIAYLRFTAICCIASIALSLFDLSNKVGGFSGKE